MEFNHLRITVLAGGVGAAKFVQGLTQVVDSSRLTIIGNTGDDVERHGLWVSPDVDTMLYTLAGIADPEKGWGIKDDSFETLSALERIGEETWFRIGDRDFATHILRTRLRAEGWTPTDITRRLSQRLDVRAQVLPMSDGVVSTRVLTIGGELAFQEFFVRDACVPDIIEVSFSGASECRPTADVFQSISSADLILIAPSNPVASIGPILALPGFREALRFAHATRVAVSPLVGGKSLKGPSDRMMRARGFSPDASGVARFYHDLINGIVIDAADEALRPRIMELGLQALVTDTLMTSMDRKAALARETLEFASALHDQHRHPRQEPALC